MNIVGTYLDPKVNNKEADYKLARKRKSKLGFRKMAGFSINKRALTKKYADNHQKL